MSETNKRLDPLVTKILEDEIPFRFLSATERGTLLSDLDMLSIEAGGTVFEQESTDKEVYLLVSGLVETVDTKTNPPLRINRITSGRYFGERSCLFDQPRDFTVTAIEDSKLYAIKGEIFLEFVHTSRSFAQSLGSILREKQGIFDAFDTFSAALGQGGASGSIDIRRLLPLYQQLNPALHPGVNAPWIDFVTCLCLYAVEVRKIRKRISDPGTLLSIDEYLCGSDNRVGGLPDGMPFKKSEADGIASVWGDDMVSRLRQIAFHREAVHVDIRRQTQSYNSRRTDIWTRQVGDATRELLGHHPSDLPPEVRVHIISSNTHSVTNCLNPFLSEHSLRILEWARESKHPDALDRWENSRDLVYAVSRDYMLAHPELSVSPQVERD